MLLIWLTSRRQLCSQLTTRVPLLRRDLIQETRQIGSLMPGGLTDALTRAEFCDLVRFLSELGRPQ